MKLNSRTYGEAGSPLIILHGLLGSLDNWHTMATKLSQRYKVFTLDLRNHGRSPHSDEINYKAMAADVREFMNDSQLTAAHLLGHSMGGKVAMQFALHYPDRVDKLVVVDIAPKRYASDLDHLLEILSYFPVHKVRSRKMAEKMMGKEVKDRALRDFLLQNLKRDPNGKYGWRINLKGIIQHYPDLVREIEAEDMLNKKVLFVKGDESDSISGGDIAQINRLFPLAMIVGIPGAGHWVHVDAPEEFLKVVTEFLR